MTKEAILGLANGALVGVTAGLGMFFYAWMQGNPQALMLAVVTWLAMVIACVVRGRPAGELKSAVQG